MKNLFCLMILFTILINSSGCDSDENDMNEQLIKMSLYSSYNRSLLKEQMIAHYGITADQTIDIAGLTREYHVKVPQNHVNAPVVFLFHGYGGDYNNHIGLYGDPAPFKIWLDIALVEDIIVVIPNGLTSQTNRRGWNDCRADSTNNPDSDDVQFISSLIDFITNTYSADPNRVYVQGTSNGGHFCIRLAQELPDKVTAIAPMLASNAENSECGTSETPVSILIMNGTSDPFLPYEGGQMVQNNGNVFSTDDTINYWVNRNKTETSPEITSFTDTDDSENSTIEKHLYSNGTDETEVVLYKVIGGGHANPSKTERYSGVMTQVRGNQNGDIEMANEVWNFFKDKSK
jgi:polyhydroxybutyrate depolymerase